MNAMRRNEEAEQKALARWLDYKGLLWCHVPNGGHRNVAVGASLKMQGVKRGVPDVLIFERPPTNLQMVGVAIELKANARCKTTPEQRCWLNELSLRGWFSTVCCSSTEAIATLTAMGF